MAVAEKRGEWFWIDFRFGSKRYRQPLKTQNPRIAETVVGGVNRTLMLLEQEALQIPDGADIVSFILSGGRAVKSPASNGHAKEPLTLAQLKEKYIETLSIGAVERNSLKTVQMHLRHFIKTLGARFQVGKLTLNDLQEHVNARAKKKGFRGRKLSAMTLRKEIASLRAAWNWGVLAGLVDGRFPNKGLKFPKLDEKPPFQTWGEVESRIAAGSLTKEEIAELWDCLYLRAGEIAELLSYLKENGTQPWVYPLVCAAAHTGARRSELLRTQIADVDFRGNTILIHEKKRSREKRTTRRVTVTPFLRHVLQEWLQVHPGGPWLFAQNAKVVRSKTKRSVATQVTRDESHDHFKRSVAESKWKVLRGLHTLRHSFISCLAAAGVDQRIIDELAGHQTPEQQKRYRHLGPDLKQEAVARVFC
jgi:integrase